MDRSPLDYRHERPKAPFPHRLVAAVTLLGGFVVVFIAFWMLHSRSDLPRWVLRVVVNVGGLMFGGGLVWMYLKRSEQ